MANVAASSRSSSREREAQFRYGAVFSLVLVLLVFLIVAPEDQWARALAIAIAGGALGVAVGTSRARPAVRRQRTYVVGGFAAAVVVGVAVDVISPTVAFGVGSVLIASIPFALGGGVLRLIREQGVTAQAVAGALTIYLLLGLMFAFVIAFAARVGSAPYFVEGHVGTGDIVYYSFTVLTTTGFGDYTAATPIGHALAVLEMLMGQLYLVTVIGILVGSFVGRGARGEDLTEDFTGRGRRRP
jgi:hypothetical protein